MSATATETTPATITNPETNGTAKKKTKKGEAIETTPTDKLAEQAQKKAAEAAKKREDEQTENFMKLGGWKAERTADIDPKKVVSDKRLQYRALGSAVFDENVVENYKAQIEDGAEFPPIKCVEITPEDATANKIEGGTLIVWDGHQTLEASKRAKLKTVKCDIMKGNYRLARVLALGANRTHGKQLTDADKKRKFFELVRDPEMLADAKRLAQVGLPSGEKGLSRALAFVTGVSKGSVQNYLESIGKTIHRNDIVDKPKTPPAASGPAIDPNGGANPTTAEVCQKTQKEAVAASPIDTVIRELEKIIGAAEIRIANLAERSEVADILFTESAAFGPAFTVRETTQGQDKMFGMDALNTVGLMLEQVKAKWNSAKERAATQQQAAQAATTPANPTAEISPVTTA
jgi:hypothetical protein